MTYEEAKQWNRLGATIESLRESHFAESMRELQDAREGLPSEDRDPEQERKEDERLSIQIATRIKEAVERFTKPVVTPEQDARRKDIVELAKEQWEVEGKLEIDDDAAVSESEDNGAYVQAWFWLDFADTKFDKEVEVGHENDPS